MADIQYTNGDHNSNGIKPNNRHIQNGHCNGNGHSDVVPSLDEEKVVMTPKGKTSNSTVILIERKLVDNVNERQHVAGGDHTGIIINKDTNSLAESSKAQLALEFRVFLVSENTGAHTQESRTLRFWFRPWNNNAEKQAHVAQDFFRDLVNPQEFPRDYVGFIKKIMKLLQRGYNDIQMLEIELRILEQISEPASRPLSFEDSSFEFVPLTPEKVLEFIEQAYPNPVAPEDLARNYGWSEEEVLHILLALVEKGVIKNIEYNSFTRAHHEDTEIKVVKQMPTIASNKQPSIAIITAQYCEKLAVDAMLQNKETFVRYTTIGESNVYTLGNIGAHRIVSTKLPSVGSTREAMTAAGNTTTRLLGTFQKVDHVFIVGVAGGIPHFTDYNKHVRLGDVIISYADPSVQSNGNVNGHKKSIYVCESDKEDANKPYFPSSPILLEIARDLKLSIEGLRPWDTYFEEGMQNLQRAESDFTRPNANTDKLYMNIGKHEVIEVQHPRPNDDSEDSEGMNRLHLGLIGSRKDIMRSESARIEFARNHGLLAIDIDMSSVLDSVIGNCRDSFIIVKGISDYKDGTTSKKWQNYASLSAAAVVKSIICGMNEPSNV